LEFNLDAFEDFLTDKRIKISRVDLVLKIQRILDAKKKKSKITVRKNEYISCVSWVISDYDIDPADLVIDGEFKEVVATEAIDFEQ